MADNTKSMTVTTSATEIVGRNRYRKLLVIYNNGTNTVYLGFSPTDCTTASSFPLEAGDAVKWKLKRDQVFGITSSGTSDVRVMEED
jgi:hypothetical protein